jgi:hypothetical protein
MPETVEAARLLALAEKARVSAAGMRDNRRERVMLDIATAYEGLAKQVDTLAEATRQLMERE